MKKSIITLAVAALFLIYGCSEDSSETFQDEQTTTVGDFNVTPIEGSYIIVYNQNKASNRLASKEDIKLQTAELLEKNNIDATNVSQYYNNSVKGFATKLSSKELEKLQANSEILYIEQDKLITYAPPAGKGGGNSGSSGQVVPVSTLRVGGGTTSSSHTAWVIDSGIDLDHPDLNVDVARSVSFLTGSPSNTSPDDQNGHGTHVAGTIAAIDNTIGTVGVAPGSTVVAVRVLDRRGSGSTSGVLAGIDYVAKNGVKDDVANMSLGGGVSQTLDNAVVAAAAGGVKFVLAAGNESDDANNHSPARANGNNVYTISAMDKNDNFASFSNYGSPVDYCAPGVSIQSTWKDGGYNTISGTSMAAPHAAGVLLLGNASTDGYVNNDPDGNADPVIHTP